MGPLVKLVKASGNRLSQAGRDSQSPASMGPLAKANGKPVNRYISTPVLRKLQWGRWLNPAETNPPRILGRSLPNASMGPLAKSSGNGSPGEPHGDRLSGPVRESPPGGRSRGYGRGTGRMVPLCLHIRLSKSDPGVTPTGSGTGVETVAPPHATLIRSGALLHLACSLCLRPIGPAGRGTG